MRSLFAILCLAAFSLSPTSAAEEESYGGANEPPPSLVSGSARVVGSKFLLSQYAVEKKQFVVNYNLYNIGDKAARRVSLDDRHNFPTDHFDIDHGTLQVRWERISPGANVSHSVILTPRLFGNINYTSAVIQYLPSEDATEYRLGYTSAPGEGYIYRLKDYERRFSPRYSDWALFVLMVLPCLALPYLLWYKTKSRYEAGSKKSKPN